VADERGALYGHKIVALTLLSGAVSEPIVCLVSLWGSTGLPITQRPAQARQPLLSGVDEVI
jgi:hypothetical protein